MSGGFLKSMLHAALTGAASSAASNMKSAYGLTDDEWRELYAAVMQPVGEGVRIVTNDNLDAAYCSAVNATHPHLRRAALFKLAALAIQAAKQ